MSNKSNINIWFETTIIKRLPQHLIDTIELYYYAQMVEERVGKVSILDKPIYGKTQSFGNADWDAIDPKFPNMYPFPLMKISTLKE